MGVDDGRAVDALEVPGVEPLFEVLHRLAQDQAVVGGIDAHIVAGGVDALDAVDVDAKNLSAILDVYHLFIAVGGVRVRSDAHTSELLSLMRLSYAVFCLKKKNST